MKKAPPVVDEIMNSLRKWIAPEENKPGVDQILNRLENEIASLKVFPRLLISDQISELRKGSLINFRVLTLKFLHERMVHQKPVKYRATRQKTRDGVVTGAPASAHGQHQS